MRLVRGGVRPHQSSQKTTLSRIGRARTAERAPGAHTRASPVSQPGHPSHKQSRELPGYRRPQSSPLSIAVGFGQSDPLLHQVPSVYGWESWRALCLPARRSPRQRTSRDATRRHGDAQGVAGRFSPFHRPRSHCSSQRAGQRLRRHSCRNARGGARGRLHPPR